VEFAEHANAERELAFGADVFVELDELFEGDIFGGAVVGELSSEGNGEREAGRHKSEVRTHRRLDTKKKMFLAKLG
jgi:hypothetical protein